MSNLSDEYLANAIRDMNAEDERARANGEAHGNYGEEYRAVVEDLIVARMLLRAAHSYVDPCTQVH